MNSITNDIYNAFFSEGYNKTLYGYLRGKSRLGGDYKHPVNHQELRRIIAYGNDYLDKLLYHEKTLNQYSHSIESRIYKSCPASRLLIYIEGHDTAGKTSVNSLISPILKNSGYNVATNIFRAPTELEKCGSISDRYEKSVDNLYSAVIWERGPAGDWVYGNRDRQVVVSFLDLESNLIKRGYKIIKLHLRSEKYRQARALGKRSARLKIAQEILSETNLSEEQNLFAMFLSNNSINERDIHAFNNYDAYDNRFNEFVRMTNKNVEWCNIDTTHRAASRLDMLVEFNFLLFK